MAGRPIDEDKDRAVYLLKQGGFSYREIATLLHSYKSLVFRRFKRAEKENK